MLHMKIEFIVAAKCILNQILMTKHCVVSLTRWSWSNVPKSTCHNRLVSPCHRVCVMSHSLKRTDMPRVLFTPRVVWPIQATPSTSGRSDGTWGNGDKCLRHCSCHFYLAARWVKLNCTAEASGFIEISQRLNGIPRLLSLSHRTNPSRWGWTKYGVIFWICMALSNEALLIGCFCE